MTTPRRDRGGRRPLGIYWCPKCGLNAVPDLRYCGPENDHAACAGSDVDVRLVKEARLADQAHLHRRCARCDYPSIIPADGDAVEP